MTTPATRKAMQGNRRTDTAPELALRSELHRRGLRFRKDLRLDLGEVKPRPDIVFTRVRVAVFVDGCFWHSCPEHGRPPGSNREYWGPKLARNVERDRLHNEALTAAGWTVVRAWEHERVGEVASAIEERVREGWPAPKDRPTAWRQTAIAITAKMTSTTTSHSAGVHFVITTPTPFSGV